MVETAISRVRPGKWDVNMNVYVMMLVLVFGHASQDVRLTQIYLQSVILNHSQVNAVRHLNVNITNNLDHSVVMAWSLEKVPVQLNQLIHHV